LKVSWQNFLQNFVLRSFLNEILIQIVTVPSWKN